MIRRAGCYCRGEREIKLEADLSYKGTKLDVQGTIHVPCPWCNPRPYIERPWADETLAESLYQRFPSPGGG